MQLMIQSLHNFVTQNKPNKYKEDQTYMIVYTTSVTSALAYVGGNMSIYEQIVLY